MSDQTWASLIGFLTVAGLRVYHNTLLAFCWVIASVGSWVLERTQKDRKSVV